MNLFLHHTRGLQNPICWLNDALLLVGHSRNIEAASPPSLQSKDVASVGVPTASKQRVSQSAAESKQELQGQTWFEVDEEYIEAASDPNANRYNLERMVRNAAKSWSELNDALLLVGHSSFIEA